MVHVSYSKNFGELLEVAGDAVIESILSPESSAPKAAVLYSCLLIEAAANCCLFDLGFSSKLCDEFDKLPSLTKFDLFLAVKKRGRVTLDRGNSLYQDVKELKKVRDLTVHPKQSRINWSEYNDDGGTGENEKTKRLGISHSVHVWNEVMAINAFKAANAFLNNFFREICRMKAKEIRMLLLAPINEDTEDIWMYAESLGQLAEFHGVPLDYVGIKRCRR